MNGYAILADLVAVLHFAYICYVVFGQLAILVGWPLRWRWIRNPWFRVSHLVMILVVAAEAMVDFTCPLTTWELELRALAGQEVGPEAADGFIASCIDSMMTFNGWAPVLQMGYYVFAGIVLATLFLVPPRLRRPVPPESAPAAQPTGQ
jgi:Protein of Unknown function (DUF2784)